MLLNFHHTQRYNSLDVVGHRLCKFDATLFLGYKEQFDKED